MLWLGRVVKMNAGWIAFWTLFGSTLNMNGTLFGSIMAILFAAIFAVWAGSAIHKNNPNSSDRKAIAFLFILTLILEAIVGFIDWLPIVIMVVISVAYFLHDRGHTQ